MNWPPFNTHIELTESLMRRIAKDSNMTRKLLVILLKHPTHME